MVSILFKAFISYAFVGTFTTKIGPTVLLQFAIILSQSQLQNQKFAEKWAFLAFPEFFTLRSQYFPHLALL